ncbi:hypothetical protein ONZ43_g7775 [Nemania bipapillata]|uniref:Uncharacterized protein n=1 Tax=Nemania bipapillata TaxID=110536 RepID=A0ACC2HNQ0_9PEZI|nr:hypothetical protein ONZ43_g7775 [Nemania bipapillata]
MQSRNAGETGVQGKPPRGAFIKAQVAYINETIAWNARTPMPTWSLKLETYTRRYRKFRQTVTGEIKEAMRNAAARFERSTTATCMMDLVLHRRILDAEKAGKPASDPTTDQNMLDEMFGYDSTASTLAWFVRFMEAYPDVQEELRAALKEKFPELPSVSQILDAHIPYLDAVCEESFRLAGTSKGNLRQAITDTNVLGFPIPKGAEVMLNMHVNGAPCLVDDSKRSPSCQVAIAKHGNGFLGEAGKDLHTFEPRRWLIRDPATGHDVFDAYRMPSLAFGGGYRGCFGRKLATMEFRITIVLLILNFKFLELPDDCRSMQARESIFRRPQAPFAKIQVLK